MRQRRRSCPLCAVAVAVLGLALGALPLWGQTSTLSGRIVDPNGAGITNATVVLEGVGFRLSDEAGAFRFAAVEVGEYPLRVEALGYEPVVRTVVVDADIELLLTLSVDPIELDSITVDPEQVRVEGRIWDPAKDIPLPAADVVTDQDHQVLTTWSGRFRLDAWREAPLTIGVRAFRYLPFDTTVVPTEDDKFFFELRVDPLVERMITTEVVRLDERAGGRRAAMMPALHRDELLRWPGATLADVLRLRFPHRASYPPCLVLNERSVGPTMIAPTLENTRSEEVERMEFLFDGAMIRVYTSDFMRTLLGGGRLLREPAFSPAPSRPLCQ